MAVSKRLFAKNLFTGFEAMGDKKYSSDATMVIHGFDELHLLIKTFPHPILSTGEAVEIPMPMGLKKWQEGQVVVQQSGSITLSETVVGHGFRNLRELLKTGGRFDATVYEGTPESHTESFPMQSCSFTLEPAERDWESQTPLEFTGTLSYHYFGEQEQGDRAQASSAFANLGN